MKRKNSYDFIRFIAASLVVFGHAFALSGFAQPHLGSMTLAGVAVWTFFILSGYLIAASWDQYPRFNVFFAKRSLRIFPALILAVLLTILVCGLFFSSISVIDYFKNSQTLSYFNNILLLNPIYSLPGVFESNIYPNAINGSLWTLQYEFLMYIAVGILGALGIYKKISIIKIWIILLALQVIILALGPQKFDFFILYFQFNLLVTLSLMFFTGVLFWKKSKNIKLNTRYGFIALSAFILLSTFLPKFTELFATVLLAYSLFAIGKNPLMSWFGKYGDFSYGIYIYHFPIMQMIIASQTNSIPTYKLFVIGWAISIAIASVSWWIIEARALKLKSKINLKKYPLPQADSAW